MRLKKVVQDLKKDLITEIKRAVELMGGKLNSLSQQFVDDYAPLTRELAKLVNLANTVKSKSEIE